MTNHGQKWGKLWETRGSKQVNKTWKLLKAPGMQFGGESTDKSTKLFYAPSIPFQIVVCVCICVSIWVCMWVGACVCEWGESMLGASDLHKGPVSGFQAAGSGCCRWGAFPQCCHKTAMIQNKGTIHLSAMDQRHWQIKWSSSAELSVILTDEMKW